MGGHQSCVGRISSTQVISKVRPMPSADPLQVLWCGHFYDYSGYAKANREIVLRVGDTFTVGIENCREFELCVDEYTRKRLGVLEQTPISADAPRVRFFSPIVEEKSRHRICYTMFETETMNRHWMNTLNENYNECWVPTRWNAEVFRREGARIPVRVMPLGVDRHLYRPAPRENPPVAYLATTPRAGRFETAQGFVFFSLYQPTFRKGADVLLTAFEQAFGDDPQASLVLAVTAHSSAEAYARQIKKYATRSRVYVLTGGHREQELAGVYRGVHAYVSASRGEGWNMPAIEAAASGLPVIAPRNTAHLDFMDDTNAFIFDPEGVEVIPDAGLTSPFYEGQLFSKFGSRSIEHLASHLRAVRDNYPRACERATRLRTLVCRDYTWDRAADRVKDRLVEVCQGIY